jgi:putative ATP-dependent endonuclease of OLD family
MGAPASKTTAENILPFYAANATREIIEGFFAKVVVLVEGPTEELSLPLYLEKCGLSAARDGVAIIAVHGKGNLAKWRRLFLAYSIPTYCIFDNDSEDDKTGAHRRDALRAIGIADASHDTYIKATDWVVESEFSVFGSDFEQVLRQHFQGYKGLEAHIREEGVESKPFVARQVAERMKRDPKDPGWMKFDNLATALWAKIPGEVPF